MQMEQKVHDKLSGDGSYAWSVGSGKEALSYSKLVSPVYETGNSNECLLFWYNMHGPDVQTFDINIVEKGTGKRTTIWTQQGDQGVGWKKVSFVLIETGFFYKKVERLPK